MLDEEPIAPGGPSEGEGAENTGADSMPAPLDHGEPNAASVMAALLREPEVGEAHAHNESTEATERAEPADSAEAREPADSAEATERAEPEPVEPETAEATEATKPTEATEPAEAAESAEPEPAEPETAEPAWRGEPDLPVPETPAPRRPRRTRIAAAFAGILVIVAIVAGGGFVALSATSPTPSPATATIAVASTSATPTPIPTAAPTLPAPSPSEPEATPTPEPSDVVLAPDAGTVAFADDFLAANVGWPTASTKLTSLSMGHGVYAVSGKTAATDHLVEGPYQPRLDQVAVTATATQSSGKGIAGFGVTCGATTTPEAEPPLPGEPSAAVSPQSSREILFEFVVLNNGGWYIARRDGSPNRAIQPLVLMHGTTGSVPGARPLTVSGICASAPDGSRTRLIFTIAGVRVMDFSDVSATVTDGWRGGVVVSTVTTNASVYFRHFEIRDLSAR